MLDLGSGQEVHVVVSSRSSSSISEAVVAVVIVVVVVVIEVAVVVAAVVVLVATVVVVVVVVVVIIEVVVVVVAAAAAAAVVVVVHEIKCMGRNKHGLKGGKKEPNFSKIYCLYLPANANYSQALKYYLQLGVAMTDYFSKPVTKNIYDDNVSIEWIKTKYAQLECTRKSLWQLPKKLRLNKR